MSYDQGVLDRFWAKTSTDHDLWFDGTQCIIWTGAKVDRHRKQLYGRYCAQRHWWVAHQFSYAQEHGEVPEGMEIDHLCRRSLCVNPLHLEAVTPCENRRRAERHRLYQLTCPAGHLRTPTNMQAYRSRPEHLKTSYRCAQCNRENAARWVAERRKKPLPRRTWKDIPSPCKNGHERTKKNTSFNNLGGVVCADCHAIAWEKWKSKRR